LFRFEIGDVIVVPIIARCECLEKVVYVGFSISLQDSTTIDLLITKSGVGPEVPLAKPAGIVSGFRKAGDRRSISISG
jgi:hypothetical protein